MDYDRSAETKAIRFFRIFSFSGWNTAAVRCRSVCAFSLGYWFSWNVPRREPVELFSTSCSFVGTSPRVWRCCCCLMYTQVRIKFEEKSQTVLAHVRTRGYEERSRRRTLADDFSSFGRTLDAADAEGMRELHSFGGGVVSCFNARFIRPGNWGISWRGEIGNKVTAFHRLEFPQIDVWREWNFWR